MFSEDTLTKTFCSNYNALGYMVDNYLASRKSSYFLGMRDDLFQEASLIYWSYLLECETQEELNTIPWLDLKHALCILCFETNAFSHPKRTSSYKQYREIEENRQFGPDGCVKLTGAACDTDFDESMEERVTTILSMKSFLEELKEPEATIARLYSRGVPTKKIAEHLGKSLWAVYYYLRKMADDYRKYIEVPD